jgi:transcriptional regulator with XRE-family HTH domain
MSGDTPIKALRIKLGQTLEDFAASIGVPSKGVMSEIERGLRRLTLPQALAVERLSEGTIDAADLNDEVAMARRPIAANG